MTMRQPSFFDEPAPRQERRPPNLALIRRHLNDLLRIARKAEILPWHAADARHWQEEFPTLARMLPREEGLPMIAEFEKELARLGAPR